MLSKCVQSWNTGRVFVICAPAGTGKTTLAKRLANTFPNVSFVPTLTTRPKRPNEVHGRDYFFVSKDDFDARLSRNELIEHIELHGNWYGTSKQELETVCLSGKHALLVIDTRGALEIRKRMPCVLIFIRPPSIQTLRQRLEGRGTEDAETIQKRIDWAKREMADEPLFDYSIENADVDLAFQVLSGIIIAESHKVHGS
jgi:guanylate kinase